MSDNFCCGSRVRELRQERSLSQARLARKAGITTTYLGLVERGKRNATVATIEAICRGLNISLADFFSVSDSKLSGEGEISYKCAVNMTVKEIRDTVAPETVIVIYDKLTYPWGGIVYAASEMYMPPTWDGRTVADIDQSGLGLYLAVR